ncbi:MAG: 50S ribosomal protein L10 [Solirubrobacteraceae bacterium]|jgi:large subunit ribosomal protein L10
MNREQKAVAIAEIATHIDESSAIFAVDYRGISVAQAAELRTKLREADATFKVVKNSLTERAAEEVGAETLKPFLSGPTALTFVRGDVATAAKTIADYGRLSQLLPFKGGLMEGAPLDVETIRTLSRLPSREVLYGQLVGVVASPVSGLVRTLFALLGGLAVALGQVREKKDSGEIPAGEPPAAAPPEAPAAEAPQAEVGAESPEAQVAEEPVAEPPAEAPEEPVAEPPQAEVAEEPVAEPPAEAPEAEAPAEPVAEPPQAEAAEEPAPEQQAEPEKDEPAEEDDKQADASAEVQSEDAEANPTKED